jgi:hypothetical protein
MKKNYLGPDDICRRLCGREVAVVAVYRVEGGSEREREGGGVVEGGG